MLLILFLNNQLLFFFWNSVIVYSRGDLQHSISISFKKKLKSCFILKKGQYLKRSFLSFNKPYN